MTRGIDYAWSHPPVALIKAAGFGWVARYLSHDSSKNIHQSEARALRAAGLEIVTCWEYGAQDMLRGHAGGVDDAKGAVIQLAEAGLEGAFVYFAADWDAAPGQQGAINAYLDGAATVLGKARVGIYGGYYPCKRALDAGKAAKAWQTFAWSGGNWDHRAAIRQGVTAHVGGVSCDLDESMVADFGQWPRPKVTPDPPVDPPVVVAGKAVQPTAVHATARYTNATVTWAGARFPAAPAGKIKVDIVDDHTGDHVHPSEELPGTASGSHVFRGLKKGHRYRLGVYAEPGAPGTHSAWAEVTTRT